MTDEKHFWGPAIWKTIHSMAMTYEPKHRESFKMFIYSLTELLPCNECRENWKKNLNLYPIDDYLKTSDNLFFWTYLQHNAVNKEINLKMGRQSKFSPLYKDVKHHYYTMLKGCQNCRI